MLKLITILILFFGLIACGDMGEPFERVTKLRALGVNASPLVSSPSTDTEASIVNLIFHLLVPTEQDITAEVFIDEDSLFAVPLEIILDQDSATYTEYSTRRYYTINGRAVLPNGDLLDFDDENDAARLQYAVEFRAGSEVEKVVGSVFVQKEPEEFSELEVEIVDPVDDEDIRKGKEIDIEAEVTNENGELVKMGWFVSGGSVLTRRAQETKWETGDDDKQLLVATVRGKRSRSFALDIIELDAE